MPFPCCPYFFGFHFLIFLNFFFFLTVLPVLRSKLCLKCALENGRFCALICPGSQFCRVLVAVAVVSLNHLSRSAEHRAYPASSVAFDMAGSCSCSCCATSFSAQQISGESVSCTNRTFLLLVPAAALHRGRTGTRNFGDGWCFWGSHSATERWKPWSRNYLDLSFHHSHPWICNYNFDQV